MEARLIYSDSDKYEEFLKSVSIARTHLQAIFDEAAKIDVVPQSIDDVLAIVHDPQRYVEECLEKRKPVFAGVAIEMKIMLPDLTELYSAVRQCRASYSLKRIGQPEKYLVLEGSEVLVHTDNVAEAKRNFEIWVEGDALKHYEVYEAYAQAVNTFAKAAGLPSISGMVGVPGFIIDRRGNLAVDYRKFM